jgi:hypothetical protein
VPISRHAELMGVLRGVVLVVIGTAMVVRRRRVAVDLIPNRWTRGYFAYTGPTFLVGVGVLLLADAALR